ncbi:cytochrome c [Halobacteriovorax sp. HLS]|uniref:cytochrome c n=1 Tax=Halobacteriovorax sp. HLS TaxID=2234000 RepID=UPI000FD8BE25|nr:cytochrome c [Halobacteriovorax sp. HLS]
MKLVKPSILLILLTLSAFASDKAPTLKSVMQGLGESMDELNRGIFYEDFKIIEKAAYKVANHPKPKSQLPTVIKTLNIRMPKFKSFDSKVHDSAMEIVEFAKKRDMDNILKRHKVIMNNCVACHTQFRSEISKALSN